MLMLRRCTAEDVPMASQMLVTVYAQEPWKEKWPLERAEKRIKTLLSGDGRRGYAMILETATIGYLFGRKDYTASTDVFYVDDLFVHPRYQRNGCGSLALAQLADELKKEGVGRMELHPNTQDIHFYEKNGFNPSGYMYLEKEL